jgi:hypothetical protein
MSRPRDSQSSKFYRAVWSVADKSKLGPREAGPFFRKCLRSKRLRAAFPTELAREIGLDWRRGGACSWSRNSVSLGKSGVTQEDIASVIAHVIHWRTPTGNDEAWHGREFCRIYLVVVRALLGGETEKKLKLAFREHKVKFTKKRPLSEGLRKHNEAMKALLEAARFVGCGDAGEGS